MRSHEIEIRVRYSETDAQGVVHHANYPNFFEIGRVELLRAAGQSYRGWEENGMRLVVTDLRCEYLRPAHYDDLLRLVTTTLRAKGARIVHRYELFRDEELIARGETTVACIAHDGKVRRLPDWLQSS